MAYQTDGYWYILNRGPIRVERLDGYIEAIQPLRIVERVLWIDSEGLFQRLRRRLSRNILIKLPNPGLRFATISKWEFERYFRPTPRPRGRWGT